MRERQCGEYALMQIEQLLRVGEDGAPLRHAEQRLEGGHYAAHEEAEVLDLVRVRVRVSG